MGGGHGHKLQAEEGVGSSCIESAHMKGIERMGGLGGFPPESEENFEIALLSRQFPAT